MKRYIAGLDLIRLCAALLVVIFHYAFWIWSPGSGTVVPEARAQLAPAAPFTWFGWIGVEIFFTLSGFVIAYSAANVSPLAFAKARIVRLYPGAFLCASGTLAVLLTLRGAPARSLLFEWAHSVLILPKRFIDTTFWTLPVELVFYALIGLLLFTRRYHQLGRAMAVLGSASAAYCLLLLAGELHWIPINRPLYFLIFSQSSWWMDLTLLRYGSFFALGALLWLLLLQRATPLRCAAALVATLGALAEIRLHYIVQVFYNSSLPHPWAPALAWALGVAAIIASVRWNQPFSNALGPAGCRRLRVAGLMTYPLYLAHQRIGYTLFPILRRSLPDGAVVLLLTAAALLASYLVALHGEKPLQRKLKALLDRYLPTPQPPVTANASQGKAANLA